MFGISFSELIIVLIVAAVVVRPKDLPYIINICKNIYRQFRKFKKEFFSYYQEFHDDIVMEEESEKKQYVLDDKGVPQIAYDISDLKEKSMTKKTDTETKKKTLPETV